ncbi:MAG: hypothetical protein ACK5MK_09535 [Dysgonomonas sp.]
MKTKFLFPHKCKWIGCIIVLIGLSFGYIMNNCLNHPIDVKMPFIFGANLFSENSWKISFYEKIDVTLTITTLLLIIGGLMIAFSRERVEDEFIARLRLNSLLWAVFVNYLFLILTTIFVYGINFLEILYYNMFTVLIIFIVVFNLLLFKYSRKDRLNEK